MTRYTPAQIIQHGLDFARETHTPLYVELGAVQAETDWESVSGQHLPGRPLARRGAPPPAALGRCRVRNELALPTPHVPIDRLTPAGFTLWQHGVILATRELEQLHIALTVARAQRDRLAALPGKGDRARQQAQLVHDITVTTHRHAEAAVLTAWPASTVTSWDVPVRIPGGGILAANTHHLYAA